MKRKNINIAIFALATIGAIPFVGAINMDTINMSTNSETSNEYNIYYKDLKREFYEELSRGDFRRLEEKLESYLTEIDNLNQNPEVNYSDIKSYKIKVQVLEDLKQKFLKNVKTDINTYDRIRDFNVKELKKEDMIERKDKIEKDIQKQKFKEKQERIEQKENELKKNIENKEKENMKKIEAEKKRLKEKIKKIREEQLKKAKELENKQKELAESKKEKIKQIKDQLKEKYKTRFENILRNRIETMDEAHIKKVLLKIDKALEKTKNEKIIAKFEALKELFESRLQEIEENIN